ncbi:MAG: SAF domain-containing protein [Anaerovoracaceae bacterium]|nr:SAF domain-containing protein [Anaerovoracaceae bacterium]
MRSIKLVTGVVLIVAAITGFTFWESHGRDMLYETELAVASGDIKQGELITEKNVEARGIGNDYVMSGAVKAEQMADIMGKKAKQYIPKGGQISADFLTDENDIVLKDGESVYCISSDMIGMVSSSLRRGDRVHIYGGAGKEDLGSYTVAFVKDDSDREVKNASELKNDTPLARESSNYTISSIEIVCTRDAYSRLSEYVDTSEKTLTIVQEVA